MYKNSIVVNIHNGIHIRIAAMIVHKASELTSKYNVNLYVRNISTKEPLAISMLALVSLKIRENELIEISCREDSLSGRQAVLELCSFITNDIERDNKAFANLDDIIEENNIANEQILDNIPIGIIVIDTNSYITTMNDYALKLIDKTPKDVVGRYVKHIIPTSDLPKVIASKRKYIGTTQHINNHICIVNRAPIFSNKKVIGAIGMFQDISELVGMQELNEKFQKILETSHDLICFVDEDRKISYVNPAYEFNFNVNAADILGKDLKALSPNGLRLSVFNSKKNMENVIHSKNDKNVVSTVEPIFINGNFKGVLSISKTVDEVKDLYKKLEQSKEEINYYKSELKRHANLSSSFSDIIGNSSTLKDSLLIAEKASNSTSTVLIMGESGTGKELVAKAIHNNSSRKDKPFVRVNCAAIPENLLESELFGYERGAFTGAVKNKPGKFNVADGGTIFLDEIGDMPMSMQVKLLRVIQEKEFESVGGIETQKVDVRIIAATNRNLEKMIKGNSFREDLYYRLNVINISLPPLRNRKEDINCLVEHFIVKLNKKLGKSIESIDKDCLLYLQDYHWPGNIRELENIIERAMNLCDGKTITSKDLPFYITNSTPREGNLINLVNNQLMPLEAYEKELITLAMEKYKSYNKAGKVLGITHRTVSLKCKKYNIPTN
ncbi:sigma 54-interacting transcriptional regulator [Clostridium sp. JN-9]|uniref:sigma 54-interacting transcriptional regulator n=1 Tax=Clostridium sp. JN-9 TaxID=2507159 RepID=UPI000FFE0D17|nr:sigma 54-interacting transcriptional regulator [Clostridium sp. JN-9]QAT41343.1 PAS domain-containing protein [Clostridium sp. JN-9]